MTDRFSPRPVDSIPSGYEVADTSDFVIPPCGLEDVDVAMFDLFDKELRLFVSGDDTTRESAQRRIPVIFAAGEKWALLKNNRPLRDKGGSLILPLITIMRTSLDQEFEDITGRGINQQTGNLVIKRKLAQEDRNYQSLINRLLLPNQENLAINPGSPGSGDQLYTLRPIGDLSNDPDIRAGALLKPNRLNNTYEILTIPAPQFFTCKYEVTIWTQYTQHMNKLLELIMSSMLPQGRSFKLTTSKGYWFVARLEGKFTPDVNFDDTSGKERIIKYKLEFTVPAYVLASSAPGVPIPVKRYVSSPTLSFEVATNLNADVTAEPINVVEANQYPFPGADDPTLPMEDGYPQDESYRETSRNFYIRGRDSGFNSYPRGRLDLYKRSSGRLVKVSQGVNGETVYKYSK